MSLKQSNLDSSIKTLTKRDFNMNKKTHHRQYEDRTLNYSSIFIFLNSIEYNDAVEVLTDKWMKTRKKSLIFINKNLKIDIQTCMLTLQLFNLCLTYPNLITMASLQQNH